MSKQTSKTTLILKEDEYRGDLRLNYPFNLRQEGETKENFAARRNRLYRNRSYFKDALLAEREAAKAPKLEASVPVDIVDLRNIDDDIHWHLDKVRALFDRKPMEQWPNIFRQKNIGRVVHVSEWLHGTSEHFIYEMNGKKDPVDESSHQLYFKNDRAREIRRTFLVQVLQGNCWCDLFKIAPSTLEDAGNGLFAARVFKAAEIIGLYIGSVRKADNCPAITRTEYALAAKSGGVNVIIDPGRVISGEVTYKLPVYFGIHFANDPQWKMKKKGRNSRHQKHKAYNVEIRSDMRVVTLCDIKYGEEIFLDYEGNFFDKTRKK
jgi:hypothetical protein